MEKTAYQLGQESVFVALGLIKVAKDIASPTNRAEYDKMLAERKSLNARFETNGLTSAEMDRRGDISRALHGAQDWRGRPKSEFKVAGLVQPPAGGASLTPDAQTAADGHMFMQMMKNNPSMFPVGPKPDRVTGRG